MILGSALVIGGTIGMIGIVLSNTRKNANTKEENVIESEIRDFTGAYTTLFENLGVMDNSKGHWIQCYGIKEHDCYRLITFRLSDSLSCKDFSKIQDKIAEKLHVPDNNFFVYAEKGYMYFKLIRDVLPVVDYSTHRLKKHLLPIGYNLDNKLETITLTSDPNILVGGVPTSGKTTLLHVMIMHIIENNQGLLWLIDLKAGLEFGRYRGIKQVMAYAQDLEPSKAVVQSFTEEMERRFQVLEKANMQKYEDYIEKYSASSMPRGFLIIDEFTDLMQLVPKGKGKEHQYNIIDALVTLGRKCRCVGLHLILSSQGLNATSLDPNIKRVCSAVVGFRAVNSINSQVVIDEPGLEDLPNYQAMARKEGRKTHIRTMKIDKEYIENVISKNLAPKKIEPPQKIVKGEVFKQVI